MRGYCLSKAGVESKWVQYQEIEVHRPLLIYDDIVQKNNMGEVELYLRIVQKSLLCAKSSSIF